MITDIIKVPSSKRKLQISKRGEAESISTQPPSVYIIVPLKVHFAESQIELTFNKMGF